MNQDSSYGKHILEDVLHLVFETKSQVARIDRPILGSLVPLCIYCNDKKYYRKLKETHVEGDFLDFLQEFMNEYPLLALATKQCNEPILNEVVEAVIKAHENQPKEGLKCFNDVNLRTVFGIKAKEMYRTRFNIQPSIYVSLFKTSIISVLGIYLMTIFSFYNAYTAPYLYESITNHSTSHDHVEGIFANLSFRRGVRPTVL